MADHIPLTCPHCGHRAHLKSLVTGDRDQGWLQPVGKPILCTNCKAWLILAKDGDGRWVAEAPPTNAVLGPLALPFLTRQES